MRTPAKSTGVLTRVSSLHFRLWGNAVPMVGILVAAVLAALTFAICMALGLPVAGGIVLALVVLVASVPTIGARLGLLRDY
jgi:F0F1-type ATP synthase membrane subunit a